MCANCEDSVEHDELVVPVAIKLSVLRRTQAKMAQGKYDPIMALIGTSRTVELERMQEFIDSGEELLKSYVCEKRLQN